MAWGTLTAGARQLPLLRCSGGGCFLLGFCIRRRLADGRIKRRQGFCPMRADRLGGTPLSSVAPSKATGWPVARRCSSRSCWQGPPAWAQTTALPAHKFSCCLNNGGSRCGEGGCQRAPKKGAPPLHWVNKSFGGGSGLLGLGAHMQGPEGWELPCPAQTMLLHARLGECFHDLFEIQIHAQAQRSR